MQVVRKIKIGPFLVISSVLAVWTLLAVGSVQAHVYNSVIAPSCSTTSNRPTATGFFTSAETLAITASKTGTGETDLATKQGDTDATGEGNENYRYAKITIPTIAAGELRIFDGRTTASNVSAAKLCKGGTEIASYSKSYSSSKHTDGHSNHPGEDAHAVFKIRAQVSPGDEEYIVIIDSEDPSATLSLKIDFHGAIYRGGVGKNTTRTGLIAPNLLSAVRAMATISGSLRMGS